MHSIRPKTKPWTALKKALRRRVWLNPSGSGHISWSVAPAKITRSRFVVRGGKVGKKQPFLHGPDVEFHLADCTRKIELDFCTWESNKISVRRAVLRKVDLLCDEVIAFRNAVHQAYASYDELKLKNPDAKAD